VTVHDLEVSATARADREERQRLSDRRVAGGESRGCDWMPRAPQARHRPRTAGVARDRCTRTEMPHGLSLPVLASDRGDQRRRPSQPRSDGPARGGRGADRRQTRTSRTLPQCARAAQDRQGGARGAIARVIGPPVAHVGGRPAVTWTLRRTRSVNGADRWQATFVFSRPRTCRRQLPLAPTPARPVPHLRGGAMPCCHARRRLVMVLPDTPNSQTGTRDRARMRRLGR